MSVLGSVCSCFLLSCFQSDPQKTQRFGHFSGCAKDPLDLCTANALEGLPRFKTKMVHGELNFGQYQNKYKYISIYIYTYIYIYMYHKYIQVCK